MQLLRIKFNIPNLIKGREVKITLKEDYTDSVSIWKFQKRIDKFKDDILNLKSANGKKPDEHYLILKYKVNKESLK